MGILEWLFGGDSDPEPEIKLSNRICDTPQVQDRPNLTRGKWASEAGDVERVDESER